MYAQVAVFTAGTPQEIARFTIGDDGQLAAAGEDSERMQGLLRLTVYDPASQTWVTSEKDPVAWVKWLPGKLRDPRGTVARLDPETAAKLDAWATGQLKSSPEAPPSPSAHS